MEGEREEWGVEDAIVVFLAGAFVGMTVGPRLARVAQAMLAARFAQFSNSLVDRIEESVRASSPRV